LGGARPNRRLPALAGRERRLLRGRGRESAGRGEGVARRRPAPGGGISPPGPCIPDRRGLRLACPRTAHSSNPVRLSKRLSRLATPAGVSLLAVSILGHRVLRSEDDRFLRGRGQYVENIPVEGAATVTFVRSLLAHARINGIDKSAAEAIPGV